MLKHSYWSTLQDWHSAATRARGTTRHGWQLQTRSRLGATRKRLHRFGTITPIRT